MVTFLDRVLKLWMEPLPQGDAALTAFRELYADPVPVNGVPLSAAAMVERARAMHRAFADIQADVVSQVETSDYLAVVLRQRGRHVGPLATPLGEIAPTGRVIEVQIIDVLKLENGRITDIRMISDQLGLLLQLDAVALRAAT